MITRQASAQFMCVSLYRNLQLGVLLILSAVLLGCGGSGSDGAAAPEEEALFVSAGPDFDVFEQSDVTLSAEVSGSTENLTYRWTASPQLAITQADSASSAASFTAPVVTEATAYILTVSVSSGNGLNASDEVVITVLPENNTPVAEVTLVTPPDISPSTFNAGKTVIISGSNSSDSDASDATNTISEYSWEQTAGTNVLDDAQRSSESITIVTPVRNDSQTLTFELTVTDEEGATDTASISIVVQSATETLPEADAGPSQSVFSGEPVVLRGEASTTISSARPLQYEWLVTGDTPMTIASPESLVTYAIAPEVSEPSTVMLTLVVTDANNNRVERTAAVLVQQAPNPLMNDTGVTAQVTGDAITQAQQNDYPGQDAQRGQDIITSAGLGQKAGRGDAAFDFTKLSSSGDEEDADDTQWSCVRDNITGLVWEIKTTDGSKQDNANTYTWFSTNDNGGYNGDIDGTAASCNLTDNCNTENYILWANTTGLCGFYDWRLPNHEELMSVVHFGKASGEVLDTDYFPNSNPGVSEKVWYWTSQPSADGVQDEEAQNVWVIDFLSGTDGFKNKSAAAHIRLVRAGR